MFLLLLFLLVLKHPHTNMMHFSSANCSYFALYSICNIQYFPVFTTVGLSQLSITVRGMLSGGSDSNTVDSD